jgi:hypothetical protein
MIADLEQIWDGAEKERRKHYPPLYITGRVVHTLVNITDSHDGSKGHINNDVAKKG